MLNCQNLVISDTKHLSSWVLAVQLPHHTPKRAINWGVILVPTMLSRHRCLRNIYTLLALPCYRKGCRLRTIHTWRATCVIVVISLPQKYYSQHHKWGATCLVCRKGVTLTPLIRNNMFYQRCLIAMKVSYQHHILRATRLIDAASLPKWYHLEITSSLQCEMSSRHVTKRTFW